MNIKNRYILIVILLIAVTNLHAQDSSLFKWNRLQYGGFAHYVYNSQDADFKSFPWIPSCAPNYSSGSGYGFDFGGLIDYPIWGPLFAGGRLGLEIAKDKLIADESFLYVGNDVTVKKGLIKPFFTVTSLPTYKKLSSAINLSFAISKPKRPPANKGPHIG